jgi:hypothetical protein
MHSSAYLSKPRAPYGSSSRGSAQNHRGGPASARDDLEYQRQLMQQHRRQKHEKWVADHQAKTRLDHTASKVRADLIVNEARRLEKEHLQHQLQYARSLVRWSKKNRSIDASDATPPPKLSQRRSANTSHLDQKNFPGGNHTPDSIHSGRAAQFDAPSPTSPPRPNCACLQAPLCRQISAKYRALALLKQTFDHDKVEEAWETLRETYASDHDMLEDLVYRYGPEGDDVSPMTRLRSVEEKVEQCDQKWRAIGANVMEEMRYRDAFPNVIRNLSIMRIFLEGSQAPSYGCDTGERARRDAFHQQVLDQLSMERNLFLTPRRERA